MRSLSPAVAAILLSTLAQASPVADPAQSASTPEATQFMFSAAHETDAYLRPHSARVPAVTTEQRAREIAAFATMAKTLPTLPYYTRYYSVPIVNANLGAQPPVPTTFLFQHAVVGTDPSSSLIQGTTGVTTYVPVRLIPVVITAPDGTVYDPTRELVPGQLNDSLTLDESSPVFTYQPLTIGGVPYGNTQLLDAWVRGERWRYTQNLPNYHLYLTPSVGAKLQLAPTAQQFTNAGATPTSDGSTLGAKLGRVFTFDATWMNQQFQAYLQAQNIDPSTIPVFVTSYNILTFSGQDLDAGYHYSFGTQTFIWHSYIVPQQTPPATQPVQGMLLQHELAELIDHPFPTLQDQPSCQPTGYEVGDPLEDGRANFVVSNSLGVNYVFQDLTFAGWNEGEQPSTAILGRYTLQNAFRFACF